jgi:O-methyltransferase
MPKLSKLIHYAHVVVTMPISLVFLFDSKVIHPAYRMSWFRRLKLGFTMFLNNIRIPTGSSYRAHMIMAMKILETSPETPGDVIECGTWKGGSGTNLSLVCKITGRKLRVYDSFEGLPEGQPGDREAKYYKKGEYAGPLDEVKRNFTKYGAIEQCEFIKGWFKDTLPQLDTPVLLAFLDVDLEDSLETCVKYIWPNLVDSGFIFLDECTSTDYVALFYSEKWWQTKFDRLPPGLIGAGTGLCIGTYYAGPREHAESHPLQHAGTGAYTQKSMSGYWSYYPDENIEAQEK